MNWTRMNWTRMNWTRMNWTRGLFRLWLLASIPWIIYVVVDARMTAASSCASYRQYYAQPPLPAPAPDAAKSKFERMLEEGLSKSEIDELDASNRERAEQYRRLTYAERMALAEQSCGLEFHAATKNIAVKAPLLPVGLILAAAVLFIAGTVLVWVVRGFRRTETPA